MSNGLKFYAAGVSAALAIALLTGAAGAPQTTFEEIDVERINIREADGRLRMIISGTDRAPGIIVEGEERPHPAGRDQAGMIFYTPDETEVGGLIFSGGTDGGRAHSGGSLTFDRYKQDQTVQLAQVEDGPDRYAGIFVNDRPEGPMDFEAAPSILAMEDAEARAAALEDANFGAMPRAFLGRRTDDSASLDLHDAEGRKRLQLHVGPGGDAEIRFFDAGGNLTKRVAAAD